MPRKTWDTKADFDGAYQLHVVVDGQVVAPRGAHYERRVIFAALSREWARILAHYVWPLDTSICLIGTGFGWSIEYLNSLGYADVWGVDNSAYIQEVKNETDPGDLIARSLVPSRIHDADFSRDSEAARFLRDSGHDKIPFDVCVTERVLTSLEDAEAVGLSSQLRSLAVVKSRGQVIHIETPLDPSTRQDSGYNWKTLEDWKALLPNDIFVASGGGIT